jgi:hypothetical protein
MPYTGPYRHQVGVFQLLEIDRDRRTRSCSHFCGLKGTVNILRSRSRLETSLGRRSRLIVSLLKGKRGWGAVYHNPRRVDMRQQAWLLWRGPERQAEDIHGAYEGTLQAKSPLQALRSYTLARLGLTTER